MWPRCGCRKNVAGLRRCGAVAAFPSPFRWQMPCGAVWSGGLKGIGTARSYRRPNRFLRCRRGCLMCPRSTSCSPSAVKRPRASTSSSSPLKADWCTRGSPRCWRCAWAAGVPPPSSLRCRTTGSSSSVPSPGHGKSTSTLSCFLPTTSQRTFWRRPTSPPSPADSFAKWRGWPAFSTPVHQVPRSAPATSKPTPAYFTTCWTATIRTTSCCSRHAAKSWSGILRRDASKKPWSDFRLPRLY